MKRKEGFCRKDGTQIGMKINDCDKNKISMCHRLLFRRKEVKE